MKSETYTNKLAALLGLQDKVPAKTKTRNLSHREVAVREEEIQFAREAQGIVYFLLAPELFTPKVCKHCKEGFLVSRKQVGYCSYTCIKKSLEEIGIDWSKDGQFEALAQDQQVWDKNEPIWIKNIDAIKGILSVFDVQVD